MKRITHLLFFSLIFYVNLNAQPGTIDKTFGVEGKVLYNDVKTRFTALLAGKENKLITLSYLSTPQELSNTINIIKFNADGNVDQSFGSGGKVEIEYAEGSHIVSGQKMLLQPDEKILICGRVIRSGTSADIGIFRLNKDGLPDNSFGEDGVVVLSIGLYDLIGDMVLQPDGKILITGVKGVQDWEFAPSFLVRLLPDGSLDTGFGENGTVLQDFIGENIYITSMALLPDNKIIIGGSANGYYDNQLLALKYNTDGTPDESFGNQGIFESRFSKYPDGTDVVSSVNDLLILPNGNIWVTGTTYTVKYGNVLLARLKPNGIIDSTFGDGKGYTVPVFESEYTRGENAYLVKGNKIITTGLFYTEGTNQGFAVFSFNAENGSPDTGFGINGVAFSGFGNLDAIGFDNNGALQPDGKIVIGGSIYLDNDDDYTRIGLIRFNGDGGVTPDNYVRLKRWMHKHGFTWPGSFMNKASSSYDVQRSSNGKDFATVAKVAASNNNGGYAYEDASPLKGINYYRVTYTNEGGKAVYSNMLIIKDESSAINIYPNPVKNNIQVSGLRSVKTKLIILDISGNIKMTKTVYGSICNIDIANLKQGNYILRIEAEGKEAIYKKFLKE